MSNSTLRIVIERHPNTEMTSFHVNRRITDSSRALCFSHNNGETVMDSLFTTDRLNVEPFALQIAEAVYEIPGVTNSMTGSGVRIENYELSVSHARAFDENDIEFAVVEKLSELFGVSLDDIEYELDDYARSDEYKQRQRESERAMASFGF